MGKPETNGQVRNKPVVLRVQAAVTQSQCRAGFTGKEMSPDVSCQQENRSDSSVSVKGCAGHSSDLCTVPPWGSGHSSDLCTVPPWGSGHSRAQEQLRVASPWSELLMERCRALHTQSSKCPAHHAQNCPSEGFLEVWF